MLARIVHSAPAADSALCSATPAVKLGAIWFVVTTSVISDCIEDVDPMSGQGEIDNPPIGRDCDRTRPVPTSVRHGRSRNAAAVSVSIRGPELGAPPLILHSVDRLEDEPALVVDVDNRKHRRARRTNTDAITHLQKRAGSPILDGLVTGTGTRSTIDTST